MTNIEAHLPSAKCTRLDTSQISYPNTCIQQHPPKVTPCTQEPYNVPFCHAWFHQSSSVGLFSCLTGLGKTLKGWSLQIMASDGEFSPSLPHLQWKCLYDMLTPNYLPQLSFSLLWLLFAHVDFSTQIILLVDLYCNKKQAVYFHSCCSLLFWHPFQLCRDLISPLTTIQLILPAMPDVWLAFYH